MTTSRQASRRLAWLDGVAQDIRYAVRALRRSPGFTLTAVATLALGIGVNVGVFRVANAVLFRGFPLVDRNDRILYITSRGYGCCVSYPDFEDWRAQAKSFTAMAAVHGVGMTLSDRNGFPERYEATEVTADTFRLVGQKPIIGRDFASSDETPGAAPVAILSYGLWERRYGNDPGIIGHVVRMNGAPTTVIGVMPLGFSFPQKQELWVPLVPTPDIQKREARQLWVAVGRMAEGITIKSARAEMEIIGRRLESAYPLTNQSQLPVVQTFRQFFIGPNATMIYGSMWGAVGFVLLIACANLGNLLLARAIGRSREVSLRMALGAGRWRIIRQLLVEGVMLSAIGGVFGWLIAGWGVRAWELVDRSWRVLDYGIDYHVVAYVIAISMGTGLLLGLTPVSRLSRLDVNAALKDGGTGATGGRRGKHLSALLVVGEMALAVVLLAGAGVMFRSFLTIYTADIGVKTANILTGDIELPVARYPRAEAQISFYDRLKTRLEAIPGVESVTIANRIPAGGSSTFPYEFSGAPPVDPPSGPTLSALLVGPAYFRTLGTAVLSGREFNDFDGPSGIPVVVVNQRFANKFWPGEDPLGKRLRLFNGKTPEAWLTVIGIAPNIVQNNFARQEYEPLVYLPYRQKPIRAMWIVARTSVSPGSLANAFRRDVRALDSDLPIFGPSTLDERLEWAYRDESNLTALLVTLAAIALLLASVGLYAVIAHSLSQRTREIGIRIAIGATARDILKLVLMQGMLPSGIGLTIGLAASVAFNHVVKSELIQVSPADPIAYIAASVVFVFSVAAGCLTPAFRAIRLDPVVALRND